MASPDLASVSSLTRPRLLVAGVALVTFGIKVWFATTTYGTNDIRHWLDFAAAVRQFGPIQIYGYGFPHAGVTTLYNHPPLIGYYLQLLNGLTHVGIPVKASLRIVSSLADVATVFLVFELLRSRASLRRATIGAVVVACSPILIIVSGFHGNTDPVFVMFVLLGVWLFAERDNPIGAGVALALALGVKIVPVVALPVLFAYALRRGRSATIRFTASFALVSAVYWLPALAEQGKNVRQKVIGYSGYNPHVWGLDAFGGRRGGTAWQRAIEGQGHFLIVAACALVPALAVWLRPERVVPATCLSLVAFLAFTPSSATQYFAWAAAPSVVLSVEAGLAYNLLGGALLIHVYDRWNGWHFPWHRAYASIFTRHEEAFGFIPWACLLVVVAFAARELLRHDPTEDRLVPAAVGRKGDLVDRR